MAKVQVTEAEILAARLTVEINDRLGRTTPEPVIRLARTPLAGHAAARA